MQQTKPTTSDMQHDITARMHAMRAEAGVKALVEYNHVRDYQAYLKATGKLGLSSIRAEQCRNHATPLAYWPGDSRVTWRIRPSVPMLAAMGYAVAETMEALDAQDEKDAIDPTVQ